MFTTLVAVVAALVLGHVAPAPVASLRRFHWWARWLDWIGTHAGEGGFWQGRSGLWLALLPPVLVLLLLQVLLHDRLWGLLGLLFGVVVLVCAWGPRDLDIDVEAALDTSDPESRGARLAQLAPEPGVAMTEDSLLPGSLMRSALRRWFAPLFWFLLLGLPGAALFRFADTADSMWGYRGIYRGRRWEWAGKWAARADDVLAWLPARLTGIGLLLAAWPRRLRLSALRREAAQTPSPNSGWPMAAMALGLDVQLRKPGVYTLHAAGAQAQPGHVPQAIRLAQRAVAMVLPGLLGLAWLTGILT